MLKHESGSPSPPSVFQKKPGVNTKGMDICTEKPKHMLSAESHNNLRTMHAAGISAEEMVHRLIAGFQPNERHTAESFLAAVTFWAGLYAASPHVVDNPAPLTPPARTSLERSVCHSSPYYNLRNRTLNSKTWSKVTKHRR